MVEFFNGVPVTTCNDTFNLKDMGCYVSYNRSPDGYGCDTTALVRMDGINPSKFLILNGNHIEQYRKLKHYDLCVEYFKDNLDQKNDMSENWDEETIVDSDGRLYIIKIK